MRRHLTHILALAFLAALATSADAWDPGDDDSVTIPEAVKDIVTDLFPERSNAGTAYLSDSYDPNMVVTDDCYVHVVFVWEGAGYKNTLGYFTYTENDDGTVTIDSANLIWPNASFASAGSMEQGDLSTLKDADGDDRVFEDGEKIGFFLVADGYDESDEVENWDPDDPTLPKTTPSDNADVGLGCYTTIPKLNREHDSATPENANHVAMVKIDGISGFLGAEDFYLAGFEDLNRNGNSDDDFNDLMFIVTADPIAALADTDVMPFVDGDPDNDGVRGIADHYPNDADRATLTRTPSHGFNVVALEDNYPDIGDADYNDAVVAYAFEVVTDADGDVKDVMGTFHLMARGAVYDHRFGVHMPGIPGSAKGTLKVERFLSDSASTHKVETDMDVEDLVDDEDRRISNLFPSTLDALPAPSGKYHTNTRSTTPDVDAASARFYITFTTAVAPATLGSVPYDLYFTIKHPRAELDVHLPGFSGFDDRPSWLPTESGAYSFMDDNDYPWMIEVPTTWKYPLEFVSIEDGYADFSTWRTNKGAQKQDWYLRPTTSPDKVAADTKAYVPPRTWTTKLPSQD